MGSGGRAGEAAAPEQDKVLWLAAVPSTIGGCVLSTHKTHVAVELIFRWFLFLFLEILFL